jgi:hypothetical protein
MDYTSWCGKIIRLVHPTPSAKQHSSHQCQYGESPALAIGTGVWSKVHMVSGGTDPVSSVSVPESNGQARLSLNRTEKELLGEDPFPMEVSVGDETKALALVMVSRRLGVLPEWSLVILA